MNIGIMTFHWAANHGALLQTYALQESLKKIVPGCSVTIVDYKPARYDKTLKRAVRSRRVKAIRNNLKDLKKEKILVPFRNRFAKTYRYYSTEQLMKRPPDCDIFIAGSDQIWNESYTMNGEGKPTPAYYLPFHPGAKHISYAASFGTTSLKPEVQTFIRPYLQKLDGVSVRESTGMTILEKMGIPCQIVCDPSALLPSEEYHKLAQPAFSGDYVAKYFLRGQSTVATDAVKQFSVVQDVNLLPMEAWLGAIGNAKFLLTNSFHGMMVALKMHTPFAVFLTEGALSGMNDRFFTILEKLGLQDRVVSGENSIQAIRERAICWEEVDRQMEEYAAESILFLQKHCTPVKKKGPITQYRNAECCGCTACQQICPKQCIRMVADGEGFLYPQIDADSCIHCGKCIRVCPVKNAPEADASALPRSAFVARATNEQIVKASSSGGVFTVIARQVLKQQGVVFAATMSEDCCDVVYTMAEKEDDLASARRSKYVQCRKDNTFYKVKEQLVAGRQVLFCGTPCDVNGLYNYLEQTKTSTEQLILVDFICHGTPSPLVWQKHVQLQEKRLGETLQSVDFRSKENGWRRFTKIMVFSGDKVQKTAMDKDAFLQGFLKDLYLRPSCHDCAAKGTHRRSDITLADAWGAENYCTSLADEKGTSLVLINTQKGEALFENVGEVLRQETLENRNTALKYNSAYDRSVAGNHARVRFMAAMASAKNIDKWILKCCRDPFVLRMKKRIKRMIKR